MALIVEDGSLISGANTYIALADAIAFLESYYGEYDSYAALFLGNSTAHQEQILKRATYELDNKYRKRWKGFKRVESQSLDWPRVDVQDEDDYDVPEDSIDRRIQRAECEFARRIAASVDMFEDRERGGRIKSEKVDVIAVSYFDNAPSHTFFEGIDAVLKGLIKTENRIIRA